MNVLVTGGAGYIGSHAVLRLLADGHSVTVIDDLSRGHRAAIDGLRPLGDVEFVEARVGDRSAIDPLLRDRRIEAVMHFAAFALVGESVEQPLRYYRNNTAETLSLLEAMAEAGVERLVFSSTCATYGVPGPEDIPIRETCAGSPVNPYGFSKQFVERMIEDHVRATPGFACVCLRYFNVAGCDPHGRLGEDHDPETHLIPVCLDAALAGGEPVTIFGTDYATPDGTCVRDYVHVDDLIDAHTRAIDALAPGEVRAYNVGIGRGYSVREIVDACRRVSGVDIPVTEGPRRAGDPPVLYADPAKITKELGWRPRHVDIDDIVATAWRWRRDNPKGYR